MATLGGPGVRGQRTLNLVAVPTPTSIVDFRSDTVTLPTDEMRQAMAGAEVGDAVYGEDPTVRALEETTASIVGTEAAVLVPSGIMANQLAISLLTEPGDEILCDEWAHIRNYELGAASYFSGVSFRTVDNDDGSVRPGDVERLLGGPASRPSAVKMVCIENTQRLGGQRCPPRGDTRVRRRRSWPRSLSPPRRRSIVERGGSGRGAAPLVRSRCRHHQRVLLQGSGAPVGSALCGSADLITGARSAQRRFGGGMRQAGVLAAAALIGLRDRDRLFEDHARAGDLRSGLSEIFPEAIGGGPTNMVTLNDDALPMTGEEFVDRMREQDVLVSLIRPGVVRFVTHRDAAVAQALSATSGLAGK